MNATGTRDFEATHDVARVSAGAARHWLVKALGAAFAWWPLAAESGGVVAACNEASLRAAMVGGGRVTFACDGVITLGSEIQVPDGTQVTLDATGRQVTISGGGRVRMFVVRPAAKLTLINLTLADGHSIGANAGPSDSYGLGAWGGAIWNWFGFLNATNCRFIGNRATGGTGPNGGYAWGGAIYVLGDSLSRPTVLSGCTLISNRVEGGRGLNRSDTNEWPYSWTGGIAFGGAIFTEGGLQTSGIVNCSFVGNRAIAGVGGTNGLGEPERGGDAEGGAIHFHGGNGRLEATSFIGNSAESPGAGAWAFGGAVSGQGVLWVSTVGCLFASNRALAGPGYRWGAFTFPGGRAQGGAYYASAFHDAFTNCAFVGNAAIGGEQMTTPAPTNGLTHNYGGDAWGGAYFTFSVEPITNAFVNVTFCANRAQGGRTTPAYRAGDGLGGAIHDLGGQQTTVGLFNVTIVSNAAQVGPNGAAGSGLAAGGGIYTVSYPGHELRLRSSLLAYNAGGNGAGNIVDGGYNLSSDPTIPMPNGSGLTNTDPRLAPLADNGGATPTMALLSGSPALDAGRSDGVRTDQRGGARPVDLPGLPNELLTDGSDIGAFESGGYMRLTRITRTQNTAQLQFMKDATFGAGPVYRVQRRAAFRPASWVDLPGAVSSTNVLASYLDATATNAQNFYRVRVGP